MSAWAKPGVKCVCVDGGLSPGMVGWSSGRTPPKNGALYTVECAPFVSSETGNLVMRLVEHPHELQVRRFRPLVTEQDDVALFTHLLTPTRESVPC